jgi:sodium-dependent dicarboxylate transporter 2/3/5
MTRQPADLGFVTLPGWRAALPAGIAAAVGDATVALAGAVLLFLLPCGGGSRRPLMTWADCRELPWSMLLLIGGGLALARAFDHSGLSAAIAAGLADALAVLPPAGVVLLVAATLTLFTEIASNTATIALLLPLLFGAAVETGLHPLLVALPAVFSVSYGFALPVGTPPNAIAFATGRVRMGHMIRTGLLLDFLAILLVTAFVLLWTGPRLAPDLRSFPSWAAPAPAGP